MKSDQPTTTIDDYIAGFPPEVRSILEKIRMTIRKAAPGATEKISYQLPSFALNGPLVYFGAFKNHIGFYPPVQDEDLRREASIYAGEKGNLKFPLDKPIPYSLIARIVAARVKENEKSVEARSRKKKHSTRTRSGFAYGLRTRARKSSAANASCVGPGHGVVHVRQECEFRL